MKFIIKNLKELIIKDTLAFAVFIATGAVSAFMICFAYGIGKNYDIQKTQMMESTNSIGVLINYDAPPATNSEYGGLLLDTRNFTSEHANVGELRKFVSDLDKDLYDKIDYINVAIEVDNIKVWCFFSITGNGMTKSESHEYNMQTYNGMTGRYFTDYEYEDGEKVALVFDYLAATDNNNRDYIEKMLVDENHILFGDEIYEIIGYQSISVDAPIIPITAVSDDTPIVDSFGICFYSEMTVTDYQKIEQAVSQCFGEKMSMEEIELPDIDTIKMYNTVIVVAVVIAVLSVINISILYSYILSKRARRMEIFRICGMSYMKAVGIYFLECILISLCPFGVMSYIYEKCVLPKLAAGYGWLFTSYGFKIYCILFGIYALISVVVLLLMVCSQMTMKNVLRRNR